MSIYVYVYVLIFTRGFLLSSVMASFVLQLGAYLYLHFRLFCSTVGAYLSLHFRLILFYSWGISCSSLKCLFCSTVGVVYLAKLCSSVRAYIDLNLRASFVLQLGSIWLSSALQLGPIWLSFR